LGGAQAIAAFAFGTESVPRAIRLWGPGNRYVAAGKKNWWRVSAESISLPAPRELVLVGGARQTPEWIASGSRAQAEHDPDAVAICHHSLSQTWRSRFKPPCEELCLRTGTATRGRGVDGAGWHHRHRQHGGGRRNLLIVWRLEHLTLFEGGHITTGTRAIRRVHISGAYSPVAAGDYARAQTTFFPPAERPVCAVASAPSIFVKSISVQKLSSRGDLAGLEKGNRHASLTRKA